MCEFNDSGLGSLRVFSIMMHVMTAVEVPIHIFGIYVILWHTPPTMNAVKRSMLILHISSSLLDVIMCFLVIPFTIFPVPGGIPIGFLSFFNVDPVIQAFSMIICGGITGISILAFFEGRYNSLSYGPYRQSKGCRLLRFLYLSFNYFTAFLFVVPIYFQLPDREETLLYTVGKLPCLPSKIYEHPMFFVASTDTHFLLCILGGMTIFIASQVLFFVFYSLTALRKRTRRLSPFTSYLQKRFSSALYIQVATPLIVYLFPMFYVFSTWTFDILNQTCNNLVFICIALHGLLSTVTMLAVHKPYREAFKSFVPKISCCDLRKKSRVTSVRDLHLSIIA